MNKVDSECTEAKKGRSFNMNMWMVCPWAWQQQVKHINQVSNDTKSWTEHVDSGKKHLKVEKQNIQGDIQDIKSKLQAF